RDDDPTPMSLGLPSSVTVRSLKSSPSAGLLGYIVDSTGAEGWDYQSELYLYDVNAPTGVAWPVLATGDQPFIVADWLFVPGTSYLVIQDAEQQLHLLNALDESPPVPLGHHTE